MQSSFDLICKKIVLLPFSAPPFLNSMSAFSGKLAAIIEASGESQDSWARKLGLQRDNFRKILIGDRAVGPKATGKLLSALPREYRNQLLVAYLFDELVEIASHSGTAGKPSFKIKASSLPAVVKAALEDTDEVDLSEVLGPLEPKIRRLMELKDPAIAKALHTFADALLVRKNKT